MWVVVPVKRFSNAKTRLAPLLSAAERESLAQAMLNDVLRAIAEIDMDEIEAFEDLIASGVFVDLYKVVRQGLRVGVEI